MINNKFQHYKTLEGFLAALNNGLVPKDSIVFIKDKQLIWTHDTYYAGQQTAPDLPATSSDGIKHAIITQSDYNALTEYDDDTIYFILEEERSDDDSIVWTFGSTFPIRFGNVRWTFGSKFPITLT